VFEENAAMCRPCREDDTRFSFRGGSFFDVRRDGTTGVAKAKEYLTKLEAVEVAISTEMSIDEPIVN
jgi:hypothetical protein